MYMYMYVLVWLDYCSAMNFITAIYYMYMYLCIKIKVPFDFSDVQQYLCFYAKTKAAL